MIETRLTGKYSNNNKRSGKLAEVNLHVHNGHPVGIVSYNTPLELYEPTIINLSDSDGSVEMAVDSSFSGTPELVHNGTDSAEWTGSSISGTWDFTSTVQAQAGTKSIDATATVNNNEALLSDGTTTDFTNYQSLSGYVYLTKYSSSKNQIQLRFRNSSVDVGNLLNIGNFIDTGLLNSWQKFSIGKSEFGINNEIVDELVIKTISTSGVAPNYYLDTIQIEEIGGKIYTGTPPTFYKFLMSCILIQMTGPLAGTLADGTMPGISYNKLLNVSSLPSGLVLNITRFGEASFSATLNNLADITLIGGSIDSLISDGTNTSMVVKIDFESPVAMQKKYKDSLTLSISDDLSSLISLKTVLIGKTVIEED